MWPLFFQALALMFVFEGMLPFAAPKRWRQLMSRMVSASDRQLRAYGLFSMVVGMLLLHVH